MRQSKFSQGQKSSSSWTPELVGPVCCAAVPEHLLLLGRIGHHFLGGKERKPRSRLWPMQVPITVSNMQLASHLSVLILSTGKGERCPNEGPVGAMGTMSCLAFSVLLALKACGHLKEASCLCCLTCHRLALCFGSVASPLSLFSYF